MGFIGGCITGIVLTLMVFFILLFVAKALGFGLFIRNEYRRVTPNDNGYVTYSNYAKPIEHCKNCFYKESYSKEYEDDEMEEKDND